MVFGGPVVFPPLPSYPREAGAVARQTIRTTSDLEGAKVPLCPFQARGRAFTIFQGEPGEPESYTFSKGDVEILSQAIGGSADMSRLEAFLSKYCDFSTERELHELTWPEILAALEHHLVDKGIDRIISGATGKPIKADGLSPEARAIAALAENPNTSMTAIAKRAGVHWARLYDMPRFMAAWNLHRAGQNRLDHGTEPHAEMGREAGSDLTK